MRPAKYIVNACSGYLHLGNYVVAKHGGIGLMRTLANELAPNGIRVNAVMPGGVNTPLMVNDTVFKLFRPDLENQSVEDFRN